MFNQKEKELKDFLYLDSERVRSFYAQMFEGEIQTRTTNKNRDSSIKGKIQATLPGIFGAGIEPSISENRGSSETKSLHHQMYIEFEEELSRLKKLSEVNSTSDNIESSFIKIKGQIQIIDYLDLLKRVENTFDVMGIFEKQQLKELENKITDRNQLSLAKNQIKSKFKKPDEFENMVAFLKALYGESLVLNMYLDNKVFARASLIPELFQFKSTGLVSGTELLLDEEWVILGQIIKKKTTPVINTGNEQVKLDDVFASQLLPIYKQIKEMVETKPLYEIVPISVYRIL